MASKRPEITPQESVMMPVAMIDRNDGQIPGLPANPRCIAKDDFRKLKDRLTENPEFLSCNEIIVAGHEGRYIAISGNMRLEALRELGRETVPVKIIPEDTPVEEIARYVLLGNAQFGMWDIDKLAADWEKSVLDDMDIKVPDYTDLDPNDLDDDFALPDGDQSRERTVSFTLSRAQHAILMQALSVAEEDGLPCTTYGNTDKDGNNLHSILTQWEEQRK